MRTQDRGRSGCRSASVPLGLALALLLVSACATGTSPSPFDARGTQDAISLRVENRNIHDATLLLLRGKERRELGKVRGGALQYFEFAWPAGLPLDMEIQLQVGERYRLPPFPYVGGGQIGLTVASELRRSAFAR